MKGTLTLKGLDEYLERIQQAGKDIDESTNRALIAGAEIALEGMNNRVPVDEGTVRDHLFHGEPQQDGNTHSIEVGLNLKDRQALHGIYQEFGTASMQAQPFVRPAFDEDKGKIRRAMRKSLEQDGAV